MEYMFSLSFRKHQEQLVNFDYQNVNSLCPRHHYVNSERYFCTVSIELYKHNFNQSAHIFSDCFLNKIILQVFLEGGGVLFFFSEGRDETLNT